MQNISIYLEKFKNLGLEERQSKELVVKTVRDLLGVELDIKDIDYRDGEIRIKVSGAKKSVLFLNKEKIMDKLNHSTKKLTSLL